MRVGLWVFCDSGTRRVAPNWVQNDLTTEADPFIMGLRNRFEVTYATLTSQAVG